MIRRPSDTLHGILWMISSTGIFSLMAVLVRIANQAFGVNAWQTSPFRFIISIAVVLVISAWLRDPLKFVNLPWLFIRGFFSNTAACIYFYSITRIGRAKAAILTYSYPPWAGLFAPLLLKNRISPGVCGSR
ncbi:MAG: EamA family transporter [Syntrophaceae bacterium]